MRGRDEGGCLSKLRPLACFQSLSGVFISASGCNRRESEQTALSVLYFLVTCLAIFTAPPLLCSPRHPTLQHTLSPVRRELLPSPARRTLTMIPHNSSKLASSVSASCWCPLLADSFFLLSLLDLHENLLRFIKKLQFV